MKSKQEMQERINVLESLQNRDYNISFLSLRIHTELYVLDFALNSTEQELRELYESFKEKFDFNKIDLHTTKEGIMFRILEWVLE